MVTFVHATFVPATNVTAPEVLGLSLYFKRNINSLSKFGNSGLPHPQNQNNHADADPDQVYHQSLRIFKKDKKKSK